MDQSCDYRDVPVERKNNIVFQGAGPRHLVIDESTQIAYVLNELKMSINVLQLGITGEIVASMIEVDYTIDGVSQVSIN